MQTTCLFVVHDPAGEASARERVARAEAWFGAPADARWYAPLHLLAGRLGERAGETMEWSGGTRFEYRDARARLIAAPAGPLALHAAAGAWATHAVVAALLAGQQPVLDLEALPQLFAFGHVAEARTHIAEVRPLAPGTVVEWPGGERPGPRLEPIGTAADEPLLDSLREVPDGAWLGLTAGADSLVVAVALRALGVRFRTFTWGAAGEPDVDGAAAVARALGAEHVALSHGLHGEEEAMVWAQREVPLHDGLGEFPLGGRPPWPDGIELFVTGGGGETGRAFYYRLSAAGRPRPTRAQVARAWRPEQRIAGAHERAIASVVRAKAAALEHPHFEGWALLDAFYAEQRFVRWGRSMLPREPIPLHAGFAAVQCELASLALDDKLTDGFHRRFVAQRHAALAPPAPRLPRRGVPRFARELAARLRAARDRGGTRTGAPAEVPLRDWLADDVLGRRFLSEAMGSGWVAATRAAFLTGGADATAHTLQAASLAVLEDALNRLRAR